MMKKEYTTPQTTVVRIGECQLLAGSDLPLGGETNQQMAPGLELDEEDF